MRYKRAFTIKIIYRFASLWLLLYWVVFQIPCIVKYELLNMKILKSYYKTPSFLTGRCIVSLAILGLISCSDRNGKSLSEATNDPAGIYREYLYNIRRQKDSSFQVLTNRLGTLHTNH